MIIDRLNWGNSIQREDKEINTDGETRVQEHGDLGYTAALSLISLYKCKMTDE
jgi:hypothetical protein